MPKYTPKPQQPPATGWAPLTITHMDLVNPGQLFPCQRCSRHLKHVHELCHSEWPDKIYVGCCCAKRLADDYDAEQAERHSFNRFKRLQTFLNITKWGTSAKGNPKRDYKGHKVTIFLDRYGDGYVASITPRRSDARFLNGYATEDDAKLAAFEAMDSMGGDTHV